MKKVVIVFAMLVSTMVWAGTQVIESNVPQLVSMNFHYQFPGAHSVVWEKDNSSYEAKYVESGKALSIFYNSKGQIVEIDRELSISELPSLYTNRIQTLFNNDYQIVHLTVADDFSKNPYYLITVLHGNNTYEFQFEDYEFSNSTLHTQRQNTYIW